MASYVSCQPIVGASRPNSHRFLAPNHFDSHLLSNLLPIIAGFDDFRTHHLRKHTFTEIDGDLVSTLVQDLAWCDSVIAFGIVVIIDQGGSDRSRNRYLIGCLLQTE